MRIRLQVAVATAWLVGLGGLAACGDGSPGATQGDNQSGDGTTSVVESTDDEGSGASEETLPYIERLTPVANVKKATEIKVEGKDAWVTVPVASTSASSILECLQLLPASLPDETLTVIFSDGVEELCVWPEDDD